MKLLHGGYTPRVAGRPSSEIVQHQASQRVCISLIRANRLYSPKVENEANVVIGEPLAAADGNGGDLILPSPVNGVARVDEDGTSILIDPVGDQVPSQIYEPRAPQFITKREMTDVIARAGLWPFFWSSVTNGPPAMDDSENPKAVIVNCVIAEPFRARGRVILSNYWDDVIEGIRYLPRLLDEYGKVEVILTEVNDPVAKRMYEELSGHAWTRLHPVPVTYPVEHPIVLSQSLQKKISTYKRDDVIWEIDVQGVAALGKCLSAGEPLHERVIAVGGPGHYRPGHYRVRIGTKLSEILGNNIDGQRAAVLRGGLLKGELVDPDSESVQYDDDAFFCLPRFLDRELITFLRPGFNRTSYFPAFVSKLTRAKDRHISTALRGELRPCISCGACEKVCPVSLLPQVLHRYLHRGLLDEASRCGLSQCIDCDLCTFICPSKIELQKQFTEAREQLRIESSSESASVSETSE